MQWFKGGLGAIVAMVMMSALAPAHASDVRAGVTIDIGPAETRFPRWTFVPNQAPWIGGWCREHLGYLQDLADDVTYELCVTGSGMLTNRFRLLTGDERIAVFSDARGNVSSRGYMLVPALDLTKAEVDEQTRIRRELMGMSGSGNPLVMANYVREWATEIEARASVDYVDTAIATAMAEVGGRIEEATQGLATEHYVDEATQDLASETYVDNQIGNATEGLASQADIDAATEGLASQAYVDEVTEGLATEEFVANQTRDLASETYVDNQIGSATEGLASADDLASLDERVTSIENAPAQSQAGGAAQWLVAGVILSLLGVLVLGIVLWRMSRNTPSNQDLIDHKADTAAKVATVNTNLDTVTERVTEVEREQKLAAERSASFVVVDDNDESQQIDKTAIAGLGVGNSLKLKLKPLVTGKVVSITITRTGDSTWDVLGLKRSKGVSKIEVVTFKTVDALVTGLHNAAKSERLAGDHISLAA